MKGVCPSLFFSVSREERAEGCSVRTSSSCPRHRVTAEEEEDDKGREEEGGRGGGGGGGEESLSPSSLAQGPASEESVNISKTGKVKLKIVKNNFK